MRIVATGYNNMIEVKLSSFWRLENFECDGLNYTGSDGINTMAFSSTSNDYVHDLVLDGLEFHHFNNVPISTKVATWNMVIRNCHIHDTYVGLYLGNSDGYLPIMNLTFERNFVEKCTNYNMQIKAQLPRVGAAPGHHAGAHLHQLGLADQGQTSSCGMKRRRPPTGRTCWSMRRP